MRTIACALVTGALLSGAAERPPPAPESYVLAQSALVQLGDAPRLYLARPDSALEAVDLRTGRVLWHTRLAVFPILVRADRLLALLPVPRGKRSEERRVGKECRSRWAGCLLKRK